MQLAGEYICVGGASFSLDEDGVLLWFCFCLNLFLDRMSLGEERLATSCCFFAKCCAVM